MTKFLLAFLVVGSVCEAAVFRHEGLSNGSKAFEWFSESENAVASNPYPTGYQNLTFNTRAATLKEVEEYNRNKTDLLKRANRNTAKATLKNFDKSKISDLGAALEIIDALIKAQGLNE